MYWWWTDSASAGDQEEVYEKFIEGGQIQPQLVISKRFIRSLLGVDRCSLSWASGRGLLEVYWGWTDTCCAILSHGCVGACVQFADESWCHLN